MPRAKKPGGRAKRRADPSQDIPQRKRTELVEMCRQGIDFDYACHIIGRYKSEVFEQAKRDAKFKIALTKAVEEGRLADKCMLWVELCRQGYRSGTAMRMCRISGLMLSERKKVDPDFALEALEAEREGTDYLEDIARERGIKGSDTLLMFVLKARDRQRFSDTPPSISITENTLNLQGDNRHEFGRRIAFALRYAAEGEAAANRDGHGEGAQGPDVGTERGSADRGVLKQG